MGTFFRKSKAEEPAYPSPVRLLFLVATSIFFIEIAFMFATEYIQGLSPLHEALLDASSLVALVMPVLYFLIYRPLVLHIEERKVAEDALKESEKRFSQIFQQVTDYILVLEPMEEGSPIIVDASNSAFIKHGYTCEELIGKPITFLDADTRDIPVRMSALQLGQELRFEVVHRCKDGSTFVAEVSAKTIEFGEKTLVFTIERDITEKKAMERTLRESEERFRSAFDYSKVGMTLLNSDYKYIKVNNAFCEMTGYSETELIDGDFKGITHPDDVEQNLKMSKSLRAGETSFFHMEKRYIHKNGNIVWGDLTVSAVRDEAGKLMHVLAIVQDITERKEAEAALVIAKENAEEATRLKDKFVSLVSHDLKTPLSSMLGFLKLVRDDTGEPLN